MRWKLRGRECSGARCRYCVRRAHYLRKMLLTIGFIFNRKGVENVQLGIMKNVDVFLIANFSLIFGMAGLFWPEKFRPLFDILMFPWPASYRMVRVNSIAAIILSLLLAARLLLY